MRLRFPLDLESSTNLMNVLIMPSFLSLVKLCRKTEGEKVEQRQLLENVFHFPAMLDRGPNSPTLINEDIWQMPLFIHSIDLYDAPCAHYTFCDVQWGLWKGCVMDSALKGLAIYWEVTCKPQGIIQNKTETCHNAR